MLDTPKFSTKNQNIINRLYYDVRFKTCDPQNKYYLAHSFNKLMRLEFRKEVREGKLIGFRHVEIIINPHYHYNKYLHNGNDFSISQCISTLPEIFNFLGIEESELKELKVVNLEFGVNIITTIDTKHLIDGLFFYKRTKFILPNKELLYNKVIEVSPDNRYKEIKAYHKGIHCHECLKAFQVDINTFRLEIKSKQAKKIKTYGINNANDLLKIETYERLGKAIIKEWNNVLLINNTVEVSNLPIQLKTFIEKAQNMEFWEEIIQNGHRNTFNPNKERYYTTLENKDNWHSQIKQQIIEKIDELFID